MFVSDEGEFKFKPLRKGIEFWHKECEVGEIIKKIS